MRLGEIGEIKPLVFHFSSHLFEKDSQNSFFYRLEVDEIGEKNQETHQKTRQTD
jgi:hypothetical protein